LHGRPSAHVDSEVKRSKVKVNKTTAVSNVSTHPQTIKATKEHTQLTDDFCYLLPYTGCSEVTTI